MCEEKRRVDESHEGDEDERRRGERNRDFCRKSLEELDEEKEELESGEVGQEEGIEYAIYDKGYRKRGKSWTTWRGDDTRANSEDDRGGNDWRKS